MLGATLQKAADRPRKAAARRTVSHHSLKVSSLLRAGRNGLQTKLRITAPGDRFEQEADRTADQVLSMREPPSIGTVNDSSLVDGGLQQTPTIHRQCKSCSENEEMLQTKSAGTGEGPAVKSDTGR